MRRVFIVQMDDGDEEHPLTAGEVWDAVKTLLSPVELQSLTVRETSGQEWTSNAGAVEIASGKVDA